MVPTATRNDPILSSPELGRLVHLAVNSLLYSTSLPLPLPVRESPLKKVQRSAQGRGDKKRARVAHRLAELRSEHSAEDVFFLPGRISISQVRHLQGLERAAGGRALLARFMVRGHWRLRKPRLGGPAPQVERAVLEGARAGRRHRARVPARAVGRCPGVGRK